MKSHLQYLSGFGNTFQSEAESGVLPKNQNNPQIAPQGLYAEQLSGTAFTALPHENKRSWLYKSLPSVVHEPFKKVSKSSLQFEELISTPNQLRWGALEIPKQKTEFWESLLPQVCNSFPKDRKGLGVYLYACNNSNEDTYFYSSDGELLFIPQQGKLEFLTEFGKLEALPSEIVVIPRGVKFKVSIQEPCRGYLAENYGNLFRLPYLGPIGANGLANPRHFLYPTASYEKKSKTCVLLNKYQGELFKTELEYSPLNIVAWWGNYAPYKYDLKLFNTINTVSFDHPDPSIFTVLTSPGVTPGVADIDFVIFPSRWMVAENTFRPPYYHRNIMSEYMGLVYGVYDAKEEGFVPGGSSVHNCMSAHGPESSVYEKEIQKELKPAQMKDTLAFMLESAFPFNVTKQALNGSFLQKNYYECWMDLKSS